MSIYEYINYWLWKPENNIPEAPPMTPPLITVKPTVKSKVTKTPVITRESIINIKLKPISDTNSILPGPARNMPDNFNLGMLTQNNLSEILNVKLKPIIVPKRKKVFPPRNPLLLELHNKIPMVC